MFSPAKIAVGRRILIDVGTHTLKAIVVDWDGHSVLPRIIRKKVVALPLWRPDTRVAAMLHELVADLLEKKAGPVERVTIGFNARVSSAQLREWRIPCTGKDTFLVAAGLKEKFWASYEKEMNTPHLAIVHPLTLYINGYAAQPSLLVRTNPASWKDISIVTTLLTFADEMGTALRALRGMFSGVRMEFIPLAVATRDAIVRGLGMPSALVIDIGGETTEVVLLQEGEMVGFSNFPIGSEEITREIEALHGLSRNDAEDVKRLSLGGHRVADRPDIKEIMKNFAVGPWSRKLGAILDSFSLTGPTPQDIILLGGGSRIPEIKSFLTSQEFTASHSVLAPFHIRTLQGSSFFSGEAFDGHLKENEDTGLGALLYYSVYAKKIF